MPELRGWASIPEWYAIFGVPEFLRKRFENGVRVAVSYSMDKVLEENSFPTYDQYMEKLKEWVVERSDGSLLYSRRAVMVALMDWVIGSSLRG